MSAPVPLAAAADAEPRRSWRHLAPSVLLAASVRRVLRRTLRDVACGSIEIALPDGGRLSASGPQPGPAAAMTVRRWRALARLALAGDIGLAEAYRDGDWSTPDLVALLEFGLRNEAQWGDALEPAGPWRWLSRALHRARANTRRGSRQNIAFHYDLGNDFYALWLDPALLYSSALFDERTRSLEDAQAAKLDRIVALLDLETLPAEARVLEIGCGWGALALRLARAQPGRVVGLTLSERQLAHARSLVAGAGLDDRVDLRLQDYRDVDGEFDRIVSIEMLEAVGERYWPVYFETLRRRLRPGGRAVIQVITIADAHFEKYRRGADFIQRFIFPGGMLPSPLAMQGAAERAGLTLRGELRFGASYATTLVEWRRRFLEAWPRVAALGFDDRFRSLWEYYLCYCEAGFRTARVDVGLYVLEHADAVGTPARRGKTR